MAKRTHRDEHGKTCTKCTTYKTFDEYYRLRVSTDGCQSWCKACMIAYSTAKMRRTHGQAAARARKEQRVKDDRTKDGRTSAERVHYTYRIPLAEAQRLRAIPQCQCCGKPISVEARTHSIDHDYDRGRVRGVLCLQCNTGIGKLGDTSDGIEQAAYYLVRTMDVLTMASNGQCGSIN